MQFKSIFNVNLYHGYFLNEGESKFSTMSDIKRGATSPNSAV